MKRSDFILPLLFSGVIHLGLFFVGHASDSVKTAAREEVSTVTLKLISSVARNTPRPSYAFEAVPVEPLKPVPQKTPRPAPEVSKSQKKPAPKKIVKPESRKSRGKKFVKPKKTLKPDLKTAEPAATEELSPRPVPAGPLRAVNEKPALVSHLEAKDGSRAQLREKEALTAAKIVGLVKPKYPRYCRRHNQEGTVVLMVKINELGRQTAVKIVRSSGYMRLDRAAVKALEKAAFIPAKKGGRAVSSAKRVVFTFRLEDAGE